MSLEDLKQLRARLSQTGERLEKILGAWTKKSAGANSVTFLGEVLELKTPAHIREWLILLETHKQLVVEASRDHAKSWTFSRAWPLYRVQKALNPHDPRAAEGAPPCHVALISYSEDQARKNLAWIRKTCESNPWLKWLMPESKSYVWDAGKLEFSNGSTLEAFGFGSSIRGGHYHLVVIDDPTKDHWTMSVTEQENFLYGVVVPAVRREGQLVVTGNPVERQDLLYSLENNGEFVCKKYPAWNDKLEPLWPDQYTLEDLRAKQRLIPTHLFAREYLLKRVSAADATFKEEWIHYYKADDLKGIRLLRFMTIDPALVAGGDAMAATVAGVDSSGVAYVLDRLRFRGELKQGIDELIEMMVRNHMEDGFIGCEEFAFQKIYQMYLEEEIERRGLSFQVHPVGRDSRKIKAARIESLQPRIRNGRLRFLEDDHKPLVDQLLLWDPLSKTNDDDEIDALSWQVPLWGEGVADDTPAVHVAPLRAPLSRFRAQTFNEVFEEMQGERQSKDFLRNLFDDFRPAGGGLA